MVSGDRAKVADAIGRQVGVDRVYAEQSPEQKLDGRAVAPGGPGLAPVVMVGDGVNDAPGARSRRRRHRHGNRGGNGLLRDRGRRDHGRAGRPRRGRDPDRPALAAASRARACSIGMGLSIVAMGFAAAGFIAPVEGALLQEGIDVAVILNALRALRG